MAFCMNCGQQLPEGAKFCSNCGTATGEIKVEASQRKTVYEGDLHKCPNCGELINSFILVCPSCGHEFRGTIQRSSVRELATKLEEIENHRPPKKTHTFKDEFLGTYGKFATEDEQKINLIRNFAIPNTKEDILEFMILASSNIDMKLYGTETGTDETGAQRAISDAWMAKFEQAYRKAQISFSESPVFTTIQNIYSEKTKEVKKQKKKKEMELLLLFGMMFGVIVLLLIASVFVQ